MTHLTKSELIHSLSSYTALYLVVMNYFQTLLTVEVLAIVGSVFFELLGSLCAAVVGYKCKLSVRLTKAQHQGPMLQNLLQPQFMNYLNELECLSLTGLSTLPE